MNATSKSQLSTVAAIPPFAGFVTRTGPAQAGAVVHRVRPAAALVNPLITPAAPIVVVVKKTYTTPARVQITLRASSTVRRPATLTRIMTATSGNIQLFETRTGTTPITFTPTSNPAESERVISRAELNRGKVFFAESDTPSSNIDDYKLRLTLAPGPTTGPPLEISVVAVSLTLDISPPRTSLGTVLTPLPQPPATPAVPPTDKWFGGQQINAQDPGNSQKRAQLLVEVVPITFAGELRLRQVRVSGNNVGPLDNKVKLFDDEFPGPLQFPPIVETPKSNPFDFTITGGVISGRREFFVEGGVASTTARDTGFQLGVKNVENDGDRVAISVAVAPLLSVDQPIVVVRKPHTSPNRRVITVRASTTFGRTATLRSSPGGPPIRLLNQQQPAAGTEIVVTGAGHTVSSTDLTNGIQFFAESLTPSGAANDYELTLTLAPGSPVAAPAQLRLTAVELTLDIGEIRPAPGVAIPLMSATDKVNPGRFLQVRDPLFKHTRAQININTPRPPIPMIVVLTAINAQVQALGQEDPAAGQPLQPNPLTMPTGVFAPGVFTVFAEGVTPSATVGATGFRLGIDGLEPECDRVAITVLPDPSEAGPFPVGEHEYTRAAPLAIPAITEVLSALTLSDFGIPNTPANRNQTNGPFAAAIHALVRYPATTPGLNRPVSTVFPSYPLIVIAHGNHNVLDAAGNPVESFRGLEYLCRHLASYGYIAISVDLDPIDPATFPTIEQRGLVILEHIAFWSTAATPDPLFAGRVNLNQIGLIGHSRGGEAVVSAQSTNIGPPARGVNIRAIVSISQTDFLGLTHTSTPFLVIYGSADGDVKLGWPFRMYDRAAPFKSLVWVYGANHNLFSESPDWVNNLDPDPPEPRTIPAADHLNIAKGYCAGFMQLILRNVRDHLPFFKDNRRPALVSAPVEIHQQVQERAPKVLVDNFEQGAFDPAVAQGPQLAPRATTNTLGLAVSQTGLVVPRAPLTANALTEASLRNRELNQAGSNDFFWNDTFGAILAWDAAGATYTQNLGVRNVSAFRVFSFRVTQRFGSPRNPDPAPPALGVSPDFSISLGDGVQNAQVRVGTVATIPFPWRRTDNIRDPVSGLVTGTTNRFTKSAFVTIRIPLTAFTDANAALNLNALRVVIFRFDQTARGEIAIDDLEFCN